MLGFDYAKYYDEKRKNAQKNLIVREENISEKSCIKYTALFFNDIIYSNIIELKDDLIKLGYFRFAVKKIYNDMLREINSYIRLLNGKIIVDEVLFADITIVMEGIYSPILNEIRLGIDKEFQKDHLKKNKRYIISRLTFMQLLCLSNRAIVYNYRKEVMTTLGLESDKMDFVYLEKIYYFIDKMQKEILGEDNGRDLSDSNLIKNPFNRLIKKAFSMKDFNKILKQTNAI